MKAATGSGHYEQLLTRCESLAPIQTAVAYPCEATALAGAVEAASARIDCALAGRTGGKDRGDGGVSRD